MFRGLSNSSSLFRLQYRLAGSSITPNDSYKFLRNIKPSRRHIFSSKSQVEGLNLQFSVGTIGEQALGSALCRTGDTVVHAAVTSARNPNATSSFLPLTVDFRARYYSIGELPPSVSRKERPGTDEDVLVARVIDRSVRPLFPKGYVDELQLLVTTHSNDLVNDPIVAAVNAASMALTHSQVPWNGPVGCVRIGLVDNKLEVNPTVEQLKSSPLNLLYAGSRIRPLMIEAHGKEVPEELMAAALRLAQSRIPSIIDNQVKYASEIRQQKEASKIASTPAPAVDTSVASGVEAESAIASSETTSQSNTVSYFNEVNRVPDSLALFVSEGLTKEVEGIYHNTTLTLAERSRAEGILRSSWVKKLENHEEFGKLKTLVRSMALEKVFSSVFRNWILNGSRVDGRRFDEIRQLSSQVEILPVVHGSSSFARGRTRVICTTTLGSLEEARETAAGDIKVKDNFMLQYDFPPYCTGEVGNAGLINRRMVGHGNLAEKALKGIIPDSKSFPYTVKLFTEVVSSNGSSSMATVCAGSLSLMDAGVPISSPAAGISIGLFTDESVRTYEQDQLSAASASVDTESTEVAKSKYRLVTDILGMEDHYGDMDFKIAGTARGITAMQLDVKLENGVPLDYIVEALDKAKDARSVIFKVMDEAIARPNVNLKANAPRGEIVTYDEERKRNLVGPGGEMKRYIENTYDCKINLDEEGVAYIYGRNASQVKEARSFVQELACIVKQDDVFSAEVLDIKDYGLIVKLSRAQEALLHVSELSHDSALLKKPLTEVVTVGQKLEVKVIEVEKGTGQVRVSRKRLLEPKISVPDKLTPQVADILDRLGTLPSFPIIPPRRFSMDYFKEKTFTDEEIKLALNEGIDNYKKKVGSTVSSADKSIPPPPPPPPPSSQRNFSADSDSTGRKRLTVRDDRDRSPTKFVDGKDRKGLNSNSSSSSSSSSSNSFRDSNIRPSNGDRDRDNNRDNNRDKDRNGFKDRRDREGSYTRSASSTSDRGNGVSDNQSREKSNPNFFSKKAILEDARARASGTIGSAAPSSGSRGAPQANIGGPKSQSGNNNNNNNNNNNGDKKNRNNDRGSMNQKPQDKTKQVTNSSSAKSVFGSESQPTVEDSSFELNVEKLLSSTSPSQPPAGRAKESEDAPTRVERYKSLISSVSEVIDEQVWKPRNRLMDRTDRSDAIPSNKSNGVSESKSTDATTASSGSSSKLDNAKASSVKAKDEYVSTPSSIESVIFDRNETGPTNSSSNSSQDSAKEVSKIDTNSTKELNESSPSSEETKKLKKSRVSKKSDSTDDSLSSSSSESAAAAPKSKRGRKPKASVEGSAEGDKVLSASEGSSAPVAKVRKPRASKKVKSDGSDDTSSPSSSSEGDDKTSSAKVKKTKSNSTETTATEAPEGTVVKATKRGRKPKAVTEPKEDASQ